MKKIVAGIFLLVLALLGASIYDTSPDVSTPETASGMEAYIRTHINTLSPEPAVLGGTFYVTDIQIDSVTQTGVVWYEDGHNAYEAEFAYTPDIPTDQAIISFVVKK